MTLEDVRNEARRKLKGICGVYRDCDGLPIRLCQGQSYGSPIGIGGTGAGFSFSNNIKALSKIHLKMRLLGPHFSPDTTTTLFGKKVSMPVYGAPASGNNSFGGDKVITEEEFCRATVLGCKEAGTVAWRGDAINYSLEKSYGLDAIKEAGGLGIKISKPRDQDTIKQFIKKTHKSGAIAFGVDVDGCGLYVTTGYDLPLYRKSIDELRELRDSTSLPFIIKGLMCVEDAVAALNAGADAIVVSNHGGRILDHTPGTADVLPEIVSAVKGKALILVDGGIRTGYDVLKMLALGADGVLIGRDIIRAAVGGGKEGVAFQK
jgi:4-hydroxymandelate oxidase